MAAPSALSRLMQMVSPTSALSPAGRILFLKDHHATGTGRDSSEVINSGDDQAPNRFTTSPASRRRCSLRLSSCGQADGDPLPAYAAGAARRLSYEADCTLASGWKEPQLTHSASCSSRAGLSYGTESPMLPAQDKALTPVNTEVTLLPDTSEASVDAFAANLIRSEKLEDAFYVMDIGALDRLFMAWQVALPRVVPYYAVKCNPSPVLLSVLVGLGVGFDCASEAEIKQVLNMGVKPDHIIFANPCKMPSHIKYAASMGVATTTFDSVAELDKIQALFPEAQLVLRIQTRDSGARCPLGTKYGALPDEIEGLLAAAGERDLKVVGVSFHVGSGASDASAYYSAIAAAHDVFQMAAAAGRPMSLLDIGGGFTAPREADTVDPGVTSCTAMNFFQAAQAINTALDEFFPVDSKVNIIAEPGRYFAETPSTLVARVFGKRIRAGHREYWINDGLYGSMNCTIYDHAVLAARPLRMTSATKADQSALEPSSARSASKCYSGLADRDASSADVLFMSTVFGPTCDGLDVIFRGRQLPDLEMGDWLVFPNMGAYTAAAGSNFNGFATAELKTHLVFSLGAKEILSNSDRRMLKTLWMEVPSGPWDDGLVSTVAAGQIV